MPVPSVQSFLREQRPVSLLRFLRILSGILMMTSLLACILTFGDPHRQSVWSILQHHDNKIMPFDYFPTALDVFLAQAQLKSDVFGARLPPWYLPSTGPLLGLLGSTLLLFVGVTVLLPRWWIPAKVFLSFASWSDDASSTKADTPTHVLVRLPGDVGGSRRISSGSNAPMGDYAICAIQTCSTFDQDSDHPNVSYCHYHPYPTYFEHGFCRYYCDTATGHVIEGGPDLHLSLPLAQLLQWKGLVEVDDGSKKPSRSSSREQLLQVAKERFGPYAKWSLPQPTLGQALASRLSSPLVVVQLLGRLLNLLEEGISSSITQIFFTVGHHYWNARQAIVAAKELAAEVTMNNNEGDDLRVWVFRPSQERGQAPTLANKLSKKKSKASQKNPNTRKTQTVVSHSNEWQLLPTLDLLPGDVFVYPIHHVHNNKTRTSLREFPVDALLLQGQCITNEAVLTGESVPQTKIPVSAEMVNNSSSPDEAQEEEYLDMMGKHRSSILFAGTTILHSTAAEEQYQDTTDSPNPAPGIKCLVLRSGLYSSKGEIIRSLSAFKGYVGSVSNAQGDQDALRLMGCLSLFALASCISLFVAPSETPNSSFRRLIQCTRIAIASIPSDLPLALAAVTRSCAQRLRNDAQVVCSEPGSMLTAAQVEIVVFDKTGTLTADTQSLSKIVSCPRNHNTETGAEVSQSGIISPRYSPRVVLAGCQSLVLLDEQNNSKWVGDPLDLAALKFSRWTYNSSLDCYQGLLDDNDNDVDVPAAQACKLWQIKTFPFDANRRTSMALVLIELSDGQRGLFKVIKGSPDTLQTRLTLPNSTNKEDWYEMTTSKLDSEGSRTIAMGIKEVGDSDGLFHSLLPSSVGNETEYPLATLLDTVVRLARAKVANLSRAQLEDSEFDFAGFACFNAVIRPSTRRVIRSLRRGGVHVVMLTGDAMDAGILVAATAGLIDTAMPLIVLETNDSNHLVYRTIRLKSPSEKHTRSRLINKSKTKALTSRRLKELLAQRNKGKLTLAATGSAIDLSIMKHKKSMFGQMARNLNLLSLVARASPKQKQLLVQSLRDDCGKVILMCGKGFVVCLLLATVLLSHRFAASKRRRSQ